MLANKTKDKDSPNFVTNLTKSKKDSKVKEPEIISIITPDSESQNASNELNESSSQKSKQSNQKTTFEEMMEKLSKKHKPKMPVVEKPNEFTFTSKPSDNFNTPSSKRVIQKTKKRRKPNAKERVLTNIGCKNEKIYKLSELYLPNCSKIRKSCMNYIENRSSITMLKTFESKCLLEPYDLNEQFREFERNIKGQIEEEEQEEEEIDREGMELKEFYKGEEGQREKYWDEKLDNTHSLSRIFRRKLVNQDESFKGMDHVMMEKILFNNESNRDDFLNNVKLAKRNDEGGSTILY